MTRTTAAATLFGPEDVRVVERPLPELAPGMVRITFAAGGICGSDMHYFRHGRVGNFVATSPLVLGHEIAGRVSAVAAPASGLKVGDRVAVNPSRWCGTCPSCREGRLNLCDNIYFMGSASKTPHMQGGFAGEFDATPAQCVKLPDHVTFKAAALAEPLAVCLHAVARAGALAGRSGLVMGAGPIGLLTMLAARRAGLPAIAVADIAPAPLDFARRLGADRTIDLSADPDALAKAAAEQPFDAIFEATGATQALAGAIQAVRRGGTIVAIGSLPGGAVPLPANAIMAKEIDLKGSFRFGGEFEEAVRLIAAGAIDPTRIITGERPLADAPAALRLSLDRGQSMKVMLIGDAR